MMSKLKELWLLLPENYRTHIVSAFNTFVSTFLTEVLAMVATSSDFSFSRMAIIGALNVAIRAAIKTGLPIQK